MNCRPTVIPYLLGIYAVLCVALGIAPYDRPTWFAENLTVWIILAVLGILYYRGIRFSNASYLFMAVLVFLHTIGGHFTFARVPFGWVSDLFGFERNHYDRLAHFSVGFYAFPMAEWLWRRRLVAHRFLLFTYPVFAVATIAMSYELVEWAYAAEATTAEAVSHYLGSQGDVWDAQRDMLADTLGAIMATTIFMVMHRGTGPDGDGKS